MEFSFPIVHPIDHHDDGDALLPLQRRSARSDTLHPGATDQLSGTMLPPSSRFGASTTAACSDLHAESTSASRSHYPLPSPARHAAATHPALLSLVVGVPTATAQTVAPTAIEAAAAVQLTSVAFAAAAGDPTTPDSPRSACGSDDGLVTLPPLRQVSHACPATRPSQSTISDFTQSEDARPVSPHPVPFTQVYRRTFISREEALRRAAMARERVAQLRQNDAQSSFGQYNSREAATVVNADGRAEHAIERRNEK
eukprot:CAMPEP_0174828990 /NCGR_PEP_ID=MMETSP1114-20130205/1650_1 /TAXON_ID=312471 /ORGANISM="Neobodo designis, Strain CCAP 1951/1" /LENGTH=254 /DNA_ID=CAMNT_0016062723 /DNA_START=100 /DNA_END=865 /DNA_ORIENTATION=-